MYHPFRTMARKWGSARRQAGALGWWQMLWFRWQGFRLKRNLGGDAPFRLFAKELDYPVWCRPFTSDYFVFRDMFPPREYRCLDEVESSGLILDCGANVGYASAWFLTRFPGATVIAVEPDEQNVRMLRRNLVPWGHQARIISSGVWSHATGLVFSDQPYGDGLEWAVQVREARPDETPAMQAVDIGTLLAESGFDRISILKIDVERAEAEIFASNFESWLGKVDHLLIELHDQACQEIFHAAIACQDFEVGRCDELTVCHRRPAALVTP